MPHIPICGVYRLVLPRQFRALKDVENTAPKTWVFAVLFQQPSPVAGRQIRQQIEQTL
jgi:hypothetical protein